MDPFYLFCQSVLLCGVFLSVVKFLRGLGATKQFRKFVNRRFSLDTVLMNWNRWDRFTVRQLLSGGVLILGGPGSGKSSGSGKALFRSIVGNPHSNGLCLCAKPEDLDDFLGTFAAAERSEDVIVFAPTQPWRFNVLNHLYQTTNGSTHEVVQGILTIGEKLRSGGDGNRGEDAGFWKAQTERLLYHTVQIVKLARNGVSAPDLQKFLNGAATSVEQVHSPEWQAGEHHQWIKLAYASRNTSSHDAHDFEQALAFFVNEWPSMADRTRSSIMASVMGILHTFNCGQVRELISGATNFSLEDLNRRKWLIVNMPPSVWGDAGTLINVSLKYLLQKLILQRSARETNGFTVIWCDEAQEFLCGEFDGRFLAQCRSHQGCMVALTQSLHGLFSLMPGESGKEQALALLACFHHRIFHALGSAEDANYASELLGRRPKIFMGGSIAPVENIYEQLFGVSKVTSSFSEQMEAILPPRAFLNGLKRGGPENDFLVEGILVRSGEPFSTRENWLSVSFRQQTAALPHSNSQRGDSSCTTNSNTSRVRIAHSRRASI
ncbi:MAG: type IV secretory system conjugative DNA transfer family protein [Planctomycetaceae bacterium]|nr:type IV secretory system conjugative DNA transfer family protein [Planctomycetaceae bacterium]